MRQRDIIVIGASAGGVQALMRVVSALPVNLSASIFVVVHTSPDAPGVLDKVLNRLDGQRARYARNGMKIERDTIYIAPPDRHMMVEESAIRITRGPKQNRNRPSIDALFQSAAAAFRERVIGVVLTGYLGDGSAGLATIKKAGGVTVVQDPEDAQVSEMPIQALQRTDPDYCAPLDHIPRILESLVQGTAETVGGVMASNRRLVRGASTRSKHSQHKNGARSQKNSGLTSGQKKELTGLTCPECHGTIWEVRDEDHKHNVQFKCPVGHKYGPQSMIEAHSDTLERAMWAALRCLKENITLHKRLVEYSRNLGRDKAADIYGRQLREKEMHAQVLHALLDGKIDELIKGLDSRQRKRAGRKVQQETSVD
jgi:two-component system chemotaxis response regulator CheB